MVLCTATPPSSFQYPASPGGDQAAYAVHWLLDQRTFERFHVDVGVGDPIVTIPEFLSGPPLLELAGIPPTSFPSYPVTQHLAEKIHAYTRPFYIQREQSRQGSR